MTLGTVMCELVRRRKSSCETRSTLSPTESSGAGIADAAVDMDIKYDAPNLSQSQRGIEDAHNLNHGEPLTRCSAIGSCVTAMSLHSGPTVQSSQAPQISGYASPVQRPESVVPESSKGVLGHGPQKERTGVTGIGDWNPLDQQGRLGNGATDKAVSSIGSLRSEVLPANDQSTSARDGGAPRPNKGEKERHKRITTPMYSLRDGRIKDDHYIYMVLEYGEIDLAHMVAQKWQERSNSNMKIDENWLRFYWQVLPLGLCKTLKGKNYVELIAVSCCPQMLEAVNTIHDERIVHSDLKPANFMLVRGSLKLIDFGIAKAIMNDTTNIQRDAQVGTLNYMSPEAFMCNDTDSGGNIIKCGRPSDIWSLGCILYQMVYGKTPFANYKSFWAKYKEVTDRNRKIIYEPVDNPWLIDLMQRCLAWDRNERWRIPQLLEHPFLNPLVPRELPVVDHDPCRLLMERIRVHWDNPVVQKLRSEIEKLDEYHC
ncbi:hypothetical protein HU200_066934 [Digitaria exilis]|uniref:Protein kinase domain-containing protein n=1 Tax=Digitaria exilis TaxID=1010633 RepID=A0A834ZXC6_9POAL|nr:hypothetical protein HU200_066934 [Digitaria exilis]